MDAAYPLSKAVESHKWPRPGTVSGDRVATVGFDHRLFLYQGSNAYYDSYFDGRLRSIGDAWAALTADRHASFAALGIPVLSLFVPNKATSLPHLYPQPLPSHGSVIWRRYRDLTWLDSGVVVALEGVAEWGLAPEDAWARVDSHWSETGCLFAVNQLLASLGLDQIRSSKVGQPVKLLGDLSRRWRDGPWAEERRDLVVPKFEDVVVAALFDNGAGRLGEGVQGRRVEWSYPSARYDKRLCIVGNSFSGPGYQKTQIAWWLARLFSSVTFIHSGGIPTDLVEVVKPDVLIFQGLERFLRILPKDNFPLAALDAVYSKSCVAS